MISFVDQIKIDKLNINKNHWKLIINYNFELVH
jgi:hypothetical protein